MTFVTVFSIITSWLLLQFVAVFYLSLVAILVGTNARRAEEDKEEDEDTGQKCQVSKRVKTRKTGQIDRKACASIGCHSCKQMSG